MPRFAILIKLTPQGAVEYLDALPAVVDDFVKAAEVLEGFSIEPLITLGEYDIIATGMVEDMEQLAFFSSSLGAGGYFTAQTLVAFSSDEWPKLRAVDGETLLRGRPYK